MQKNLILTLLLSFFIISFSNAAPCTDTYNAVQDDLEMTLAIDVSNCPGTVGSITFDDCVSVAHLNYNLGSIANSVTLAGCCFSFPLLC